MKVITVVGARPQFIKAAPVSRAFASRCGVSEILVHTGQHYDESMSDVFFEQLEIPAPAVNLGIGSGSHGAQTGRMLQAIETVLLDEQPDWVLVYGDTNSTLAAALAAVKLRVALAHVEAGLRSHNRDMPEELNRVLTDHASDLLFAPTERARLNLTAEGLPADRIALVGDVMYDAVCLFADRAASVDPIPDGVERPRTYALVTVHRAENTGNVDRLNVIIDALLETARELPVVLPLHPRTRAAMERIGRLGDVESSCTVLPPAGYLEMLALERNARVVATDSGGVQKEAFFQRVPCVTLRTETEWVELVEAGWNRVAGNASAPEIASMILEAEPGGRGPEALYGGGRAADDIVRVMEGWDAGRR